MSCRGSFETSQNSGAAGASWQLGVLSIPSSDYSTLLYPFSQARSSVAYVPDPFHRSHPFPLSAPSASPPVPPLAAPLAPFLAHRNVSAKPEPHTPTSSLSSPLPLRAAARHCCPRRCPFSHWSANLLPRTLEEAAAEVRAQRGGGG
ncbi:unnamed protein product [Closterium sp. Naga37s-1]|nr:unnamed protein product [Closterium sp. Naga37s-1]